MIAALGKILSKLILTKLQVISLVALFQVQLEAQKQEQLLKFLL